MPIGSKVLQPKVADLVGAVDNWILGGPLLPLLDPSILPRNESFHLGQAPWCLAAREWVYAESNIADCS